MPTERGSERCPTCGGPALPIPGKLGWTLSYEPVKPWEDPQAVERAAKAFYEDRVHRAWSYDSSEDIRSRYRESMRIALRAAEEGHR